MAIWLAGERITADRLNEPQSRPYLHAHQIVTQPTQNTTPVAITLDGEVIDTINGHDPVTNNTRYTPTVPGLYRCFGQVAWVGNTVGDRSCQFRRNGLWVDDEAPYGGQPAMNGGGGFIVGLAVCHASIRCNGTGDYIELWASQSSGGALQTYRALNATTSYMTIEWVAP